MNLGNLAHGRKKRKQSHTKSWKRETPAHKSRTETKKKTNSLIRENRDPGTSYHMNLRQMQNAKTIGGRWERQKHLDSRP
jgi:hypothetical protein